MLMPLTQNLCSTPMTLQVLKTRLADRPTEVRTLVKVTPWTGVCWLHSYAVPCSYRMHVVTIHSCAHLWLLDTATPFRAEVAVNLSQVASARSFEGTQPHQHLLCAGLLAK